MTLRTRLLFFGARKRAIPELNESDQSDCVHLQRGRPRVEAAHAATWGRSKAQLSSNNSASLSVAGGGPGSEGCPGWPGKMPSLPIPWLSCSALLLLPGPRMWPKGLGWGVRGDEGGGPDQKPHTLQLSGV